MNSILEGGASPFFPTTSTFQDLQPYVPLIPDWVFILALGLLFGTLIAAFLLDYFDRKDRKALNGKIIIEGGKMYRVRFHEIELKEKQE